MSYGFVAYIDESGDDGIKSVRPTNPNGSSEWFVISALVVKSSNENAVGRWQKQILKDFGYTQRNFLHYRDLSPNRKKIVCSAIAKAEVRIFSVMSNKKNIEKYINPACAEEKNYIYWWLTRLLLERVTKFCAGQSIRLYNSYRPIKIIFSQRGGMSYDRLISYLDLLGLQTGTNMLYIKTGIPDWRVIDLGQIQVQAHKKEAGLQLVDAVAGACFEAVSMDGQRPCDPQFAEILLPRFYVGKYGKLIGNGIKPMPAIKNMRLREPQKRFFEIAGYTKNEW